MNEIIVTDLTDLIAWLRAQLDEDERVAQAATQGEWRWIDPGGQIKMALVGEQMIVPSRTPDVYPSKFDAAHIVRWDPARTLAEIDAKRQILDRCTIKECEVVSPDWAAESDVIVRLLALPYAHRPGYREEWR